ncbi:MAG: glutamate--tRNA ligase, partial [Pseudomonadota bacterium]
DELRGQGVPDDIAPRFWNVVRENLANRDEAAQWWAVFRDGPVGAGALLGEDLEFARSAVATLSEPPYTPETWGIWTAALKTETGRKGRALFRPLRLAVTGAERGPEMADVMPLLQRKPRV